MKLFLEFAEKKAELQPALLKVCTAIDGTSVINHYVMIITAYFVFRDTDI